MRFAPCKSPLGSPTEKKIFIDELSTRGTNAKYRRGVWQNAQVGKSSVALPFKRPFRAAFPDNFGALTGRVRDRLQARQWSVSRLLGFHHSLAIRVRRNNPVR